jgi:nitric oxide reductase large subunit
VIAVYLPPRYSTRCGFFGPFQLDSAGLLIEIAAVNRTDVMNSSTPPATARQIVWPSVITVISAAILIGAEVFGAAFAGGWALAILLGLEDTGAHILQAVLFAIGVFVMVAFIRAAQRIEPFTRRA